MNTADRIKAIRGNLTQAEFSEKLGIHKNTLGRYERGESEPDLTFCAQVCALFGISPHWLLFGNGPMRVSDSAEANDGQSFFLPGKMKEADGAGLVMVPMVEARLSAGNGSLITSDQVERSYAFREDFLRRKGKPQEMVLMRVMGDSMEPEIQDHDVVLIDQSKQDLYPGPIYALGFQDSIYLKRVDKLPESIILKSVNPAYPPIVIPMSEYTEDQFRVIGRILWSGREYR